jgi:hypothetical protein
MYRKFNARQQCEFRLLDRLKEACNTELRSLEEQFEPDDLERMAQRIEVFESPRRKPKSAGGGPGRQRKSGDDWLHLHGTSLAMKKPISATTDKRGLLISPVQNKKGVLFYFIVFCQVVCRMRFISFSGFMCAFVQCFCAVMFII